MDLQKCEYSIVTAFAKKCEFPILKLLVDGHLDNTGIPHFIKIIQHVQNTLFYDLTHAKNLIKLYLLFQRHVSAHM